MGLTKCPYELNISYHSQMTGLERYGYIFRRLKMKRLISSANGRKMAEVESERKVTERSMRFNNERYILELSLRQMTTHSCCFVRKCNSRPYTNRLRFSSAETSWKKSWVSAQTSPNLSVSNIHAFPILSNTSSWWDNTPAENIKKNEEFSNFV